MRKGRHLYQFVIVWLKLINMQPVSGTCSVSLHFLVPFYFAAHSVLEVNCTPKCKDY